MVQPDFIRSIPNPEVKQLGLEATVELLSSFGNHEGKALTLIYLSTCDDFQGSYEMTTGYNRFIEPSDDKPAVGQPFRYCMQSLEPLGQVVKTAIKGQRGIMPAYKISEAGQTHGLALAGTLLEWSMEHPDVSLMQVFGFTGSKGATRSPQNRFKLLCEALTSPKASISLSAIAGNAPGTWRDKPYTTELQNMNNAAQNLNQNGFVNLSRIINGNTGHFIIHDANYPEGSGPARGTILEAMYSFARQRLAAGQPIFDAEECFRFVAETMKAQQPDIDESVIRNKLTPLFGDKGRWQAGSTAIPGIERVDTFNNGALTKVDINPDKRAMLEDLVNRIYGIADGNSYFLHRGLAYATSVASSPNLRAQIHEKARKFSAATNKQGVEVTAEQIAAILRAADGPLTADIIFQRYISEYARPLGRTGIGAVLRHLVKAEKVQVSREREVAHLKTKNNFYTLSSDEKSENPTDV